MISILMPFKNEAQHLEESLNSILAQSEKEFELIAIDDHSTDHSVEIINHFSNKDSRIKSFKNSGLGIIDALKIAYIKSSGDYISRQDADDIMPPKKLEILLDLLRSSGKRHLATGKVQYFSNTQLKEGFFKYEQWLNQMCESGNHYTHIFKECILASSNWLIHRSDFNTIGAFGDAVYPEDYHFVFKLFENKIDIISSPSITHLWRDHANRASRNLKQYEDQKFFALKVSYFKKFYANQKICLWGAGPSGKKLAKELLNQHLRFHWVTNNPKKIGKIIYGVNIFDIQGLQTLKQKKNHRLIISVSQKGALESIKTYLNNIHFYHYHEF